jgi:hypothetical protein
MSHVTTYLRFRVRLVRLNRLIRGRSWWDDLLINRLLKRRNINLWSLQGIPLSEVGLVLAILLPVFLFARRSLAVGPLHPLSAGPLRPWEIALLVVDAVYVVGEIVNLTILLRRLSSIQMAMAEASKSQQGTDVLTQVWQAGQPRSVGAQRLRGVHPGRPAVHRRTGSGRRAGGHPRRLRPARP